MAGTKETNCPLCGRHCSADAPSCPRGREYFGIAGGKSESGHKHEHGFHNGHHHDNPNMTIDDKVIQLMRAAGHHLHHGGERDNAKLMSALTDDEKHTLIGLMKKCLKSWENE